HDLGRPHRYTLSLHDALPICLSKIKHVVESVGAHVRGIRFDRRESEHFFDEMQAACDFVLGMRDVAMFYIGRYDDERRADAESLDRKSTRLNSSHLGISYAVF